MVDPTQIYEIERRYIRFDRARLETLLDSWGADPPEEHTEADHYHNAPDRDFVRTDEAFRLRRVGETNLVTFKGPKLTGTTAKMRPELEFPLLPGEQSAQQFLELLGKLGYRPTVVVRKCRQSRCFRRHHFDLTLCLDTVELLGTYVELEILAPGAQRFEAEQVLTATAEELGLTEVETRSYLRMTLEALAQKASAEPAPTETPAETPGKPVVVNTIAELRTQLQQLRRGGRSVGFVPTMGALHEGHSSLLREARVNNDVVVASIFVNPLQFGPHEDLARYPRPLEEDLQRCRQAGVDLVFHPSSAELYPTGHTGHAGFRTQVEVTELQNLWEGAERPGHFRGVCTVVLKLFHLVQPDRAYFGQKDAQQVVVVRQMIQDLHVPVELVVCPTIREPDGLALSSRNSYLDSDQRKQAMILYQALQAGKALVQEGERQALAVVRRMEEILTPVLQQPGVTLDYTAVASASTLSPLQTLRGQVLLALAVRFGSTRLIDNLLIDLED